MTTIKTIEYTVYVDHCVRNERGGVSGDWLEATDEMGSFGELAVAVAEADRLAADRDALELNSTRDGLGSISHDVVRVESAAYDEEFGEWHPCGPDGEEDETGSDSCRHVVDALDLAPALRDAWDMAVKGKCRYLDYEDDGYATVRAELVGAMADGLEERVPGIDWDDAREVAGELVDGRLWSIGDVDGRDIEFAAMRCGVKLPGEA